MTAKLYPFPGAPLGPQVRDFADTLSAMTVLREAFFPRPNPYRVELDGLAKLTPDAVRALWDEYDGCNCPGGFSGEAIHMDLNRRGLGRYCAV